jgi:hypothetical protein
MLTIYGCRGRFGGWQEACDIHAKLIFRYCVISSYRTEKG